MARIDHASATSLTGFVHWAVEAGAEVRTDGWNGYLDLRPAGYRHRPTSLHASGLGDASKLGPNAHDE